MKKTKKEWLRQRARQNKKTSLQTKEGLLRRIFNTLKRKGKQE